jgi:hypothetical protein
VARMADREEDQAAVLWVAREAAQGVVLEDQAVVRMADPRVDLAATGSSIVPLCDAPTSRRFLSPG